MVGNVLILRYLSPALLTPGDFNIEINTSPKTSEVLKLLSKILQVLANELRFDMKTKMGFYNDILASCEPMLHKFLDKFLEEDINLSTEKMGKLVKEKLALKEICKKISENPTEIISCLQKCTVDVVDDQLSSIHIKKVLEGINEEKNKEKKL